MATRAIAPAASQDNLRILHISSVYPPHVIGGAEKVVAQLAEAQVGNGMDVGAAFLSRGALPSAERNGVHTFPQADRNLIWMEDVMRRPRPMRTANKLLQVVNANAADDFGKVIAAFSPDIVHTHSMVDLPPHVWARAKAGGAKLVHTLHDYDLICSRASLFRNGHNCTTRHMSCRVLSAWKKRFTRHIDAVVAVSKPVLDEHCHYGMFAHLPESRQRVIWNAMPTGACRPSTRTVRRYGPFTFGFLGRLVPEKGIEVLLRACRSLPRDGWQLKVAGKAPGDQAPFRALADGLPVEFCGFVDPVPFLDSIDVLVVPSIWREPFGLTVVEAFARGVPVIGSDQGAIADLVGAVGKEWLVPAGDVDALAAKMHATLVLGSTAMPGPEAFDAVIQATAVDRMVDDYSLLYAFLRSPACAG